MKSTSRTVLTIVSGLLVFYLFSDVKWILVAAIIIGLAGTISDKACDLIDFLWMKLAKLLSYFIPNILLSLLFYLFLFPIAVLAKVFGKKDELQLKNRENYSWSRTETKMEKASFEKMW